MDIIVFSIFMNIHQVSKSIMYLNIFVPMYKFKHVKKKKKLSRYVYQFVIYYNILLLFKFYCKKKLKLAKWPKCNYFWPILYIDKIIKYM